MAAARYGTAARPYPAILRGIPLPALPEEHRVRREAALVVFCAAFAGAVFLLWQWVRDAFVRPPTPPHIVESLKDVLGPFFTAYVAARLYSSMTRRYERQLERHRYLLAHILDTSNDGIITLDAEDRISTWNQGAAKIFGYTEDEVLGRNAALLFPTREEAAAELGRIREAVEKNETLNAYVAERVTRDGRRIRAEISVTVLRDAKGRYAGRASIVRDVTERDRIREELLRNEHLAALGEMAAAVAHEVKNPLAAIHGAVRVIGKSFPPDDARAAVVDEVQRQVRRLDATVRDLLTFARPATPRYHDVDFAEFSGRILRVLREEPALKAHRVETRVPPGLRVRADPQLLETILLNLLLNAGEALGDRAGRIQLEAERDGDGARITVRDDGPGVPDEARPHIFKPFFTTKHRGSGLGLTIVKKLVEVMGGRIELETAPGRGAAFTVTLPGERR
jgi:PAS domain S-box-containing protein